MSDDRNYTNVPAYWSAINFTLVDVLNVGPAGIQPDGTFGLYNSNSTGPLANRLKWVIETARSQNPDIKIIISQWYSSAPNVWGYDLSTLNGTQDILDYADSVANFLETWLPVSGGIDGFDIDFESTNIVKTAPDIFAAVRDSLDTLSEQVDGRQFYITVSPVVVTYLTESIPYIDYVNMQTYGSGLHTLFPERFIDIGFQSQQLLYGACPETNCGTKNLTQIEEAYDEYDLAGVHLWRLNSDDYEYELEEQNEIYQYLHS